MNPIKQISGTIHLNGSKSISNRLLILEAIIGQPLHLNGLSNAHDTVLLQNILKKINDPLLDAEDAGTVFRFLTAFLSLKGDKQVLIGSKRMSERPIGPLVEALNQLGAKILYVAKEGYPPLRFSESNFIVGDTRIYMDASVSSQFISALLMIAPKLPNGIELILEGKVVSRPYIEMTLRLMEQLGIIYMWHNNYIKVPAQEFRTTSFNIEADWSASSYFYALAVFSDHTDLQINGLQRASVQGDAVISEIMEAFGIRTIYNDKGIHLTKGPSSMSHFEYDFSDCPDIAQTVAVICAGLNIPARLSGLQSLVIKETDRIYALYEELHKLGCEISYTEDTLIIKKGITNLEQELELNSFSDHRMAMAFAPLKLIIKNILIDDFNVVDKSYPNFWRDLSSLGLTFEKHIGSKSTAL